MTRLPAIKDVCLVLEKNALALFRGQSIGVQPDSRAFGAYVEQRIRDNWDVICAKVSGKPLPIPGRRTIYDIAFESKEQIIGVDVKSKDLEDRRYADGGVCSVDNLLRFMVHRKATLILLEVGYHESGSGIKFKYARAAPIHCLPPDIYRVENLGTGQVRLNYAIVDAVIDWTRTRKDFYGIFAPICLEHYKKVARVADQRLERIRSFERTGFETY